MRFDKPGFIDYDQNLDGPTRFLVEDRKFIPNFAYIAPLVDDNGTLLEDNGQIFDRSVEAIKFMAKDPEVHSIIMDSATKMSEAIVLWVLKKNIKEQMDRNLWQPFRTAFLKQIALARNSGKHFIFTCHEEKTYNAKGEVIGATFSIPSRLTDYFGFQFTDVWRTKAIRGTDGKTKYVLRCQPDGEAPLKNSMGMPAEIDLDWAKIAPLLRKYYPDQFAVA